jgi:hypothetical protein
MEDSPLNPTNYSNILFNRLMDKINGRSAKVKENFLTWRSVQKKYRTKELYKVSNLKKGHRDYFKAMEQVMKKIAVSHNFN